MDASKLFDGHGPLKWFVCHAVTADDLDKMPTLHGDQQHEVRLLVNGVEVDARKAIERMMEYAKGQHGDSIAKEAGKQFGEKLRSLRITMDAIQGAMRERARTAGLELDEDW